MNLGHGPDRSLLHGKSASAPYKTNYLWYLSDLGKASASLVLVLDPRDSVDFDAGRHVMLINQPDLMHRESTTTTTTSTTTIRRSIKHGMAWHGIAWHRMVVPWFHCIECFRFRFRFCFFAADSHGGCTNPGSQPVYAPSLKLR